MSFLSRLFKSRKKIQAATITLIGPSQSGKTTLVQYMETGEPVLKNINTTLGIEIRDDAVTIDNWSLSAIDTGGQKLYRQSFWELAIDQADAVCFVIDATIRPDTHPSAYKEMQEQLAYAMDIIPEPIPILVLLNKQDLTQKNPMNTSDAINIFDRKMFLNRTIAYIATSAKYGDGVQEALTWLIDKLEENQ